MSILNLPYLSELTKAIGATNTITIYEDQDSPVDQSNAEIISVQGYDAMLVHVTIIGSTDLNLRIRGTGGIQNEYLNIYDYNTKEKLPKYGSVNYLPGIRTAGAYIVPLQGLNSVKFPIDFTDGTVSVQVNLVQTFGGFAPETPVVIGQSRHDQLVYSNDNKHEAITRTISGNTATEFFEPRSIIGERFLEGISHARVNVFEQTFFIFNNTNKPIVNVRIGADFSEGIHRDVNRITNSFVKIPILEPNKGVVFASDVSSDSPGGNRAVIVLVPELRLPFWRFRISYTTESEITQGDIYIQTVRRF